MHYSFDYLKENAVICVLFEKTRKFYEKCQEFAR